IPGATGRYYNTPPQTAANDGDTYSVMINNNFSTSTCSGKVHVRHDPIVVSCSTRNDPTHIYVEYNKPVHVMPSGSEYGLAGSDPNVFLNGAAYGTSHSEVILTTDPMNP